MKAKSAHIFWDDIHVDGKIPVATTRVIASDEIDIPQNRKGHADSYGNSNGAHTSGWCEDEHPWSYPEGMFAINLFGPEVRAPNVDVFKAWLREFTKIDECAWARKMLAALEVYDKQNA